MVFLNDFTISHKPHLVSIPIFLDFHPVHAHKINADSHQGCSFPFSSHCLFTSPTSYTHRHTHTQAHTGTHTGTHTHSLSHAHTQTLSLSLSHTHPHTQAYTHTHTHTHTHARTQAPFGSGVGMEPPPPPAAAGPLANLPHAPITAPPPTFPPPPPNLPWQQQQQQQQQQLQQQLQPLTLPQNHYGGGTQTGSILDGPPLHLNQLPMNGAGETLKITHTHAHTQHTHTHARTHTHTHTHTHKHTHARTRTHKRAHTCTPSLLLKQHLGNAPSLLQPTLLLDPMHTQSRQCMCWLHSARQQVCVCLDICVFGSGFMCVCVGVGVVWV